MIVGIEFRRAEGTQSPVEYTFARVHVIWDKEMKDFAQREAPKDR